MHTYTQTQTSEQAHMHACSTHTHTHTHTQWSNTKMYGTCADKKPTTIPKYIFWCFSGFVFTQKTEQIHGMTQLWWPYPFSNILQLPCNQCNLCTGIFHAINFPHSVAMLGIGIFDVNSRFHTNGIVWNLRVTREIPTLLNSLPFMFW